MTEWVEQWTCIKCCMNLEHSSMETNQMIQKATAMGNWWLAASSRQCAHSCSMSHSESFGQTSNHPGDSALLQPRFGTLRLLAFLKRKDHLWGKRFQTFDEIQENMTGWLMAVGKTVSGPQVPALKGTEASLSYVQYFLYLISSSINVCIFHITWLATFWTDLIIYYIWLLCIPFCYYGIFRLIKRYIYMYLLYNFFKEKRFTFYH